MASQDPSTAYTAAPEKKSGSWFPSFSMPKLPDFFGSTTPAVAPAPATAIAEQSSVQPGGRRRRHTKKAGRRRRHAKKGGNENVQTPIMDAWSQKKFENRSGVKNAYPPSQVRTTLKGARRRGGAESWPDVSTPTKPMFVPAHGAPTSFAPSQVRKGKGRRTRRVKKHSRR